MATRSATSGKVAGMAMSSSASSFTERSLAGLPRLKMRPLATPPFVLDDARQRVDAVGDVDEAAPLGTAVDQADGLAAQKMTEDCIATRDEPSFSGWMESRPGPPQLKGRKRVKGRP